MNRNVAIRRLWWKEIRQLVPLVALLLIVGVLLVLLTLLDESSYYGNWRSIAVIFGFPGLFAAGAGALLVGQEKESRTLDWLRSLPILPVDLMRTKLLVGLLGLVVVWLASFVFAVGSGYLSVLRDGNGSEWVWPLHSLFLFLIGFAVSWQLRSSLIGLLCVVPLACVPFVCASAHEMLLGFQSWQRLGEPRVWVMALYSSLFSLAALVWGWRAALGYLSAEQSSIPSHSRWSSPARESFVVYAPSSPAPALLWQFLAQNRSALLGISVLLFGSPLASMLFINGFSNKPRASIFEFFAPPLLIAGFLSVSWLGLLVFQGDSLQRRKMFLADRGISPALTWLTRQAVPLLLLVLAAVLLTSIVLLDSVETWNFNVCLIGAMVILGVYSVSQWLGQVVRSPIVGALVGPFLGVLMVGFLVYAASNLGASWWSIAVALTVPFIATFAATSAWMDGRTGWRYWWWHVGMTALVVLIPTSSFLSYVVMYPRMSKASKTELKEIADRVVSFAPLLTATVPFTMQPTEGSQAATELDEPSASFAEVRQRSLDAMRQQLRLPGVYWDGRAYTTWLSDAIVNRLADPQATVPEYVTPYRESVKLVFELASKLRKSLQLIHQDTADPIEIALLEEIELPLASQRMGEELYEGIAAMLADQTRRDTARRNALAASWHFSQHGRPSGIKQSGTYDMLGGYSMHGQHGSVVTARDVWEATRKAGLISEKLLHLLDANSEQERLVLRTQIASLLGFPPSFAESNTMFQSTESGRQLLYGELFSSRVPGQLWRGAWEQRAKNVARLSGQLEH